MENLENSNEAFIDFNTIRNSLKFANDGLFQLYLKDVYDDLSKREGGKGISKLTFNEYFKIPVFIAEKLFIAIDSDDDGYLSEKEFLSGFQRLFQGDFKTTVRFVFDVMDFDKDGCVTRGDVKVLCSYLPVRSAESSEMQTQYKHQMKTLEELDEIVSVTFGETIQSNKSTTSSLKPPKKKISSNEIKSSFLTFENFLHVVQNVISDVYINLLCFLYHNKPFSVEKVNGYLKHKSYKTSIGTKKVLSIEVKKVKKDNQENEWMPSPKKTSNFHSTHTYIENIKVKQSQPSTEKLKKSSSKSPEKYNSKSPKKSSPDSLSPKSGKSKNTGKKDNSNDLIRMSNSKIMKKENSEDLPLDGLLKKTKNIYRSPTSYFKDNKESISDFNLEDNLKIVEEDDFTETRNNIYHEDYIYLIEKDKQMKKYYMVLIGKEITIYTDDVKDDKIVFHNLSGCFLKDTEEIMTKDKSKYYQFSIVFSKTLKKDFYTPNKDSKNLWIENLKCAIGYFTFLDYYKLEQDIDEGRFGNVKLGVHKSSGQKVAIKIINKENLNEMEARLVRTEIDLMKLFRHVNIVRLLDHFENDTYIYIVMEYLSGGNISKYLERMNYNLTEKQAANIVHSVAQGIKYMNSFGTIHRDIKPENIMFTDMDENPGIKIIDFGLTKTLSPSETLNEGMGTITFVAPEVVLRKPYNKQIDVWSIGVLLYFLLSGILPFDDPSCEEEAIAKKVVYLDHIYPNQQFSKRSKEVIKLIDSCLVKDPDKRLTIEEFLKNDWLRSNIK